MFSLINPQYKESRCIRGIAHITGGAFYDKVARILPDKLDARINKSSWPVPKLFRLLQNKGKLSDKVLYGTFNMGIGMVLVVESKAAGNIIQKLAGFRLKSWIIGEVVKGNKSVQVV